jgi:hypothetical protein
MRWSEIKKEIEIATMNDTATIKRLDEETKKLIRELTIRLEKESETWEKEIEKLRKMIPRPADGAD